MQFLILPLATYVTFLPESEASDSNLLSVLCEHASGRLLVEPGVLHVSIEQSDVFGSGKLTGM